MPKITVRDTFKEFHTFTGDIFAMEQDGGCRVFQRNPDGKNTLLQSFGPHVFGWVRVEHEKNVPADPAPSLDRYTRAALSSVDPSARPSINSLPPGPAETGAVPDALVVYKPGDTVHYDSGDKHIVLDVCPRDGDHIEMEEDGKRIMFTLTEAGKKAVEEIKSTEKSPRKRPSRAKKSAEEATIEAAKEAGLLPATEPQTEEPAPKLDDLLASGAIKKGIPADTGIAGVMANSIMNETPQPEVDVEDVIGKAEERHHARQSCATCKGRGTVPDPDSQDPLDTMICPDC